MNGFGRRNPTVRQAQGEKRLFDRDKVSLPGALETPAAASSITLIDVSLSGAQGRGTDLPKVGEFVRLKVESAVIFGTVVWRKAEELGLQFDERLSTELMDSLRHAQRQASEIEVWASAKEAWSSLRNSR